MDGDWIGRVPALADLGSDIRERLSRESRMIRIAKGARIFGPGQTPAHFLLVLDGTIRVQQISEGGREIILYRIAGGESCVLTTACLLASEDYRAEAIAETAVEAAALPRATFDELVAQSASFRRFVFAAFGARIADLCRVIEDVAFSRLDIRLAQKLLELCDEQGNVAATHQQLATELGKAREVISRQLHEFQRRGWIRSGRSLVTITGEEALRSLAKSGGAA
jgi:CRP/FNR family transcriptional regulator